MQNKAQVVASHLEAEGVSYPAFTKRYAFTYADMTSKAYAVPVEPGSIVLSVQLLVGIEWVGGGNEDLEVGDADNATNWIGTNDLAKTAASWGNSISAGETNAAGKYFATANRIIVTAVSDAALTAGSATLFVNYSGYGTGPEREQVTP